MNIRRLVLDVDKALARPSIIEIAQALSTCNGVRGFNITVSEIDVETVGMDFNIEGQELNYEQIIEAIESTGAVVHSIDQLVCGQEVVERIKRAR
jgi:hypothetical protein